MNTGPLLLPLPLRKGIFSSFLIAFRYDLCTHQHLHVSSVFGPFHRVGEYLLLH